jgi:outer membrane receptor protein involved in Fe transport
LSWFDRAPILARDRSWSDDVDFTDEGGPNLRAFNGTPSTYFDYTQFIYLPDPECGVDSNISSVVSFPFFGDFCVFNYAWFQQLSYDTEVLAGNFSLEHDFSHSLRGRFEAFYSRRDNRVVLAPTPVLGGYIPPNHPDNPFGAPLDIAGRPLDTGDRVFDTVADTYRVIAGLEGTWEAWDWSADLLFSGNRVDTDRLNAVFSDRYYAALSGMGGPNGDLWYNPFGANPVNDSALIDWMTTRTAFGADTTENAVELEASSFFGSLPGGPVGFAAGLQYREQELDEFADEVERSGLLAGGSQITQIQADRDILAAYAEFSLPLWAGLEAQLALRYDDYSDFGSSTNPKLALAWRPGRDWLFRASYSTSFRPPSFTELFNPEVYNSGFFVDVERCDGTGAAEDCGQWEYPVRNVGNPELQPEEGESWFLGMVWSPDFLEGFDLELDYWRFEHTERIVELNPQVILDARSDKGVTRAPPTEQDIALGVPGRILELTQTYENSDSLQTSGVDFITRYQRTTAHGRFGAILNYTYVADYRLTEATLGSAAVDVNYAGRYFNFRFGIPRHRGNLNLDWQFGAHAMAAGLNYTGGYEGPFNRYEDGVPTDQPWIVDSLVTLDLQYAYYFGNQKTVLRLGCRNCSDESPPVTFNSQGDGLYDYRGALVYARIEHRF